MIVYEVTSEPGGIVVGLGVFEKGETRPFTEADVEVFKNVRGVPFNDAAMPEGFHVTVKITSEGGES